MAVEGSFPAELEEDPGNPVFVEFAQQLRSDGRLEDAAIVCLRGVSANPDEYRGRLLLANIFYQLECIPFALRELHLLQAHFPESTSLAKLLQKLDPSSGAAAEAMSSKEVKDSKMGSEERTVAETEFDFDDLEALTEDD